jgi:nucleoid-associated protein YgaU
MTRETKIGLLVGLAFIIIVGILLSEPLSHSGEVQPAPLPGVGSNVRSAVATPGAANSPGNPPISMQQTAVSQPATPQQTVPTQQEVTHPRGGIGIVIGPGDTQPQPPRNSVTETKHDAVAQDAPAPNRTNGPRTLVGPRTGEVSIGTGADPIAARPEREIPKNVKGTPGIIVPPADNNSGIEADSLSQAAKAAGEELEPFGKPRVAQPGGMAAAQKNAAKGKAQEYEVQAGDSLGKIAAKFYGSSAKTYQDAIVAANPSLKGDRNKILVGVSYVIPAAEATAQGNQPASQQPQQPAQQATDRKPSEKPAADEHWYVVKEKDTLWGIAKDQVGDSGAVAAIKELNKDSLKGGDTVRVGMKLKLPAKAMASAS